MELISRKIEIDCVKDFVRWDSFTVHSVGKNDKFSLNEKNSSNQQLFRGVSKTLKLNPYAQTKNPIHMYLICKRLKPTKE